MAARTMRGTAKKGERPEATLSKRRPVSSKTAAILKRLRSKQSQPKRKPRALKSSDEKPNVWNELLVMRSGLDNILNLCLENRQRLSRLEFVSRQLMLAALNRKLTGRTLEAELVTQHYPVALPTSQDA